MKSNTDDPNHDDGEYLVADKDGESAPLKEENEEKHKNTSATAEAVNPDAAAKPATEEDGEEKGETLREFIHWLFAKEEQQAERATEVVANLGCTTMALEQVAKQSEEAFNWAANQLAQIETPKPIVTSYEAICALAAATAGNARYGLDQLAGKLGKLETYCMEIEELAKRGAEATDEYIGLANLEMPRNSAAGQKTTVTEQITPAPAKLSKKERREQRRLANKP
jgi:hypothetical protein